MTKLTESQAFEAAHAMKDGGSFASAIADAFFAADTGNKTILLGAFAPLFLRHAPAAGAASPPPPPAHLGCSHALVWQTGRSYGVFGQRMAALITPADRVLFVDLDRHIEGMSTFTTDAALSINLVMSCYDSGQYTHPPYNYQKEVSYLREAAQGVPFNFAN